MTDSQIRLQVVSTAPPVPVEDPIDAGIRPPIVRQWITLLAAILFALAGGFGLYLVADRALVEPYLISGSQLGRLSSVYRFYSTTATDRLRPQVYVLGSSQVIEGVDAEIVEKTLGGRAEVFNLGTSADSALRRLTELPAILAARPDVVVLGITFSSTWRANEPPADQLRMLPKEAAPLPGSRIAAILGPGNVAILRESKLDRILYRRKFMSSAIFWRLGLPVTREPVPDRYATNFKNPWVYTRSTPREVLVAALERSGGDYMPFTATPDFMDSPNPQSDALEYMLDQMRSAGISVVLIDMPLHPMLAERILPATAARYDAYLAGLRARYGFEFLELRTSYDDVRMLDFLHPNAAGRADISQRIGQLLLDRGLVR